MELPAICPCMDVTGWLNRTGKARLLAQLESASA